VVGGAVRRSQTRHITGHSAVRPPVELRRDHVLVAAPCDGSPDKAPDLQTSVAPLRGHSGILAQPSVLPSGSLSLSGSRCRLGRAFQQPD
jgi:hypothetical protein